MFVGRRAPLPAVLRLQCRGIRTRAPGFPRHGLRTLRTTSQKLDGVEMPSVQGHISNTNSNDWFERYRTFVSAEGSGEIRHDCVGLNSQSNYLYASCDTNGALVEVCEGNFTAERLVRSFYHSRRKVRALDVGCDTGKNLMTVQQVNSDRVDWADHTFRPDKIFWGHVTLDFVSRHWEGYFSLAHCMFVLQHMPPSGVDVALGNIARCLAKGGEFMTTFHDTPTAEQLTKLGMEAWVDETFTAELTDKEAYLRGGYVRAAMCDNEVYFYGLEWMKECAAQYGLVAKEVAVVSEAKLPFSAFSWKVVFEKQ